MELKRRDHARVLTEMVEFFALPFPFPSKLKSWSFQVVIMQRLQKKCKKKRDARAKLLFYSLNPLLFWRSRCRRRRNFVRSLFTISVRTRARSLLFSSNSNSLLLANWAPCKNRGKKWKDAKSIFQRRLHGRRRCRIVRSPMERLENLSKNVFEQRMLTEGGLFTFLSIGFAQIFSNFTSVKKLSNTNFIASRHIFKSGFP